MNAPENANVQATRDIAPDQPRLLARLWREALPEIAQMRTADMRREALAGLAGALLVIPQAITFAYLAGVPPEFGLYCAVFVGFLASFFGGSVLVGGPNTAVSILIGSTVVAFAGRGSPLYIQYVFALSLLIGLLQLIIWLARGAELFRYFSPPAIAAIKAGVGVMLVVSALEGLLGIAPLATQFFYEKIYLVLVSWRDIVNHYAVVISAITIITGLLLKRSWPRSYIVIALGAGSIVGAAIYGIVGPAASQVELLGRVSAQALPFTLPRLGPQQMLFLEHAFPSALAIAVLGLAQTLVIARDLKINLAPNLDLHKEVFAQGVANSLSPFFSTFAGSGSFNRTSVAIEMGARSPLAGMIAALGVLLIAWALSPLLTYLPMAAIAGVMVLVGIGMMQGHASALRQRGDRIVFIVTLIAVLILGLELGLAVAIVLSVLYFVASAAKAPFTSSRDGDTERISVRGSLFYASLDRLARHLRSNPSAHTELDLSRVALLDESARALIRSVQAQRAQHGGALKVIPGI